MARRTRPCAGCDQRKPGYSLDAAFYTDAAVFAADMDIIFGKHWIYVGCEPDIPEAGDTMTLDIGGRHSILLVRHDDDSVKAYHNVCRHRGARLVDDDKSAVGNLVCPYHQWTYDLDGELMEGVDYDVEHLVKVWVETNAQDSAHAGARTTGYQPGPYSPYTEGLVEKFLPLVRRAAVRSQRGVRSMSGGFDQEPPLWNADEDEILVCHQVRDETHDVKTFLFSARTPKRFQFTPGQFLTFDFPVDGQIVNRRHTISSSPTRPHLLSITVKEKAKGGLGLAVCGGSSPVSIDSPQGWWKSVNLSTDKIVDPLSRLAEAMHRHGAKIMIQATHMGRRSSYHGEHWPHLMTPSGWRHTRPQFHPVRSIAVSRSSAPGR